MGLGSVSVRGVYWVFGFWIMGPKILDCGFFCPNMLDFGILKVSKFWIFGIFALKFLDFGKKCIKDVGFGEYQGPQYPPPQCGVSIL